MSEPREIATVRDYDELVSALRARAEELNVSRATIDEVSGLASGYASKLLAAVPIKKIGSVSLGPLLGAMGMVLVLVEDPAQMRRIASRMDERDTKQVRMLADGKHLGVTLRISLRQLRKRARNGGIARKAKLSRHRRVMIAKRAARARWSRPRG